MNDFVSFLYNLANSNFYIIFIACILSMVIIATIYSIVLDIKAAKYYEQMLEVNESADDNEADEMSTMKFVNNEEVESEPQVIDVQSDEVDKELQIIDVKNDEEVKPMKMDTIDEYEKNQEEIAIISTEELEAKLAELKSNAVSGDVDASVGMDIQKYEEEQEKNAIISYDELKSRATDTVLNVTESDNVGIKVNNIDVFNVGEEPKTRNPYGYEEGFLQALKDFRESL